MKLASIYGTKEAWAKLVKQELPAELAYKLYKYLRTVEAEGAVIEKQRVALLYKASGAAEGESVTLTPDTPAYGEFIKSFGEYLDVESELQPFDMTLTALTEIIAKKPDNSVSVEHLAQLAVFFKES